MLKEVKQFAWGHTVKKSHCWVSAEVCLPPNLASMTTECKALNS